MIETSNKGVYTNLDINQMKHYFIAEIFETETKSKTFSRYIQAFGYVNNTLYVLPATSGRDFVASSVPAVGALNGITSESFGLRFSVRDGIAKKIEAISKKKNKYSKTE